MLHGCLQPHCNIISRILHPHQNILICLPAIFTFSLFADLDRNLRNNSISVSILSVVPSSTAGMTKSPILPSEGSQRGGRLNEQPLQHHMGVKYGCCIKRGQGVRQYVMHPYNKLSVCGHDEMREREKGTVMAF